MLATVAIAACGDDTSGTGDTDASSSSGEDPSDPSNPTADTSSVTADESSSGPGEESSSGPGEESSSSGEPTTDDSSSTGPTDLCGNDIIDGDEVCDGDDVADATCAGLDFDGGEIGCSADCTELDTSGCYTMTCGNGIVEGKELCDGEALDAQNCQTQGFPGGTLVCEANCGGFDTSGCLTQLCGNGTREGDEACDGEDFGGDTCVTLGEPAGVLSCSADCTAVDILGCGNPCLDQNIGSAVGPSVASGNTSGDDNDIDPSCGSNGGNDRVMLFTAPADGNYIFDTYGSDYDSKLALYTDCTTQISCNDDSNGTAQSQLILAMTEGQAVIVVVDGYNANVGNWVLNITQPVCGDGNLDFGEVCEVGNLNGGTCEAQGFPGGGELECNPTCSGYVTDGCDAQGSGDCCAIDDTAGCEDLTCQTAVCAADPSCCTGAWDFGCALLAQAAPECADLSDACDGFVLDCEDEDIGSAVGAAVTSGDTTGDDDDFNASCGSNGGNDRVIQFTAPWAGNYVFDTVGSSYDTKLSALAACDNTSQLACNDDSIGTASQISLDLAEGQSILLVVDGYNANVGAWVLNITAPPEPA